MSNPILSSRFFKDHKPTSALYQKWREIYSWSIKCLPVYEWDGVLFVGCLQTPADFPVQVPNTKVVFVLCDPEALKTCWHDFEGTIPFMTNGKAALPSTPAAKKEFTDAIPSSETAASENFSLNDADHSIPEFKVDLSEEKLTSPLIQSKQEIPEPILEEAPIEIPQLPDEPHKTEEVAPEGLSLEGISLEEKSSEPSPEDLLVVADEEVAPKGDVAAVAQEVAPINEAAPEGLIFDTKFEAPKFDADVLKTMTSIRKEPSSEPVAAATPASVPSTPTPAAPPESPLSAKPTPQAAKPAATSPLSPLASKPAATVSSKAEEPLKKAVPAKTEVIYTKPGALSSNRDMAEKQIEATTVSGIHRTANKLSEVTTNVFAEMAYHYQKSMLLLAENDQARPWKWSEQFHKQNTSDVQPISFATPNPFRIVARTQKSYHGYVVPNEVNDKFFEEWNESKTPDHLTVSPILVDETLVGFLVGIGDKSADNKNSLLLCEKLANEVSLQLKRDPQLLKAA